MSCISAAAITFEESSYTVNETDGSIEIVMKIENMGHLARHYRTPSRIRFLLSTVKVTAGKFLNMH